MLLCVQNVLSSPEICDGLDNDCNNVVDEGNPGGGVSCNSGLLGACADGLTLCQAGSLTCSQTVWPTAEQCNNIDDDCDGPIDENNPGGGGTCITGLLGECGAGTEWCSSGAMTCVQNNSIEPEKCDALDNDCDGLVDENNPESGQTCNTGKLGVCSTGTTSCQAGSLQCDQNVFPSAEICGDQLDNDCDGPVDETCACDPMNPAAICGANQHCQPQATGPPLCGGPTGTGTQYSACSSYADCAPGYDCINAITGPLCMRWCRVGFNDCSGSDYCTSLSPPRSVGSQEYGACWNGFI